MAESLVALMLDDLSICYELHLTICTQTGVEFFFIAEKLGNIFWVKCFNFSK